MTFSISIIISYFAFAFLSVSLSLLNTIKWFLIFKTKGVKTRAKLIRVIEMAFPKVA